ncbi:Hemin receptor, TonB-dependent outer membrane uptake protein [Sterolibacterium denitrificans]|uniref:Hemin receptor n=2 Tax=Sterolibacterium denitrificans TaxID=157592 RepID=A0A656Z8L5_9PROT|nr:TonB-dependent receptor [Sterolibacterium denitrificans]KYC29353.1 hemin receptor [Sterolibacterium denitrificans]SMB31014.1 Hemin receptor, TonB-dependent outer membrane uptake protein [Sterolibacterium denitrificans]
MSSTFVPPHASRLAPLAAAIAALCGSALAHAEAETTLAPVSVTAKGYEADTLSTPSSVFVADGDELRKNGAGNLGEALRGEPGFAVNSDSAQGMNPVIRGLKKESIVLLVDGMRFNSAQPAGAIASFMSFGLAERVEAVKGAASVLYGTGALGGAINVLTPQARFEPGVKLSAGASYDSASKGLRGTGVGNFSSGDHALMLGASLARIDDYEAPDGRVNRTGYDSDSFIGQYRFRIDGQQQLRLSLQTHQDEDIWYPGSTKPFTHPNPGVATAVGSTTVHSPKQERTLAEAGYSYKGTGESPFNFDVRVWRQEMERTIYAWSPNLNRDITTTHVNFSTDGFDARADWLVHPQHLLSFGVNLWDMDASPNRLNANPPNSTNYVRTDPFTNGRIRAAGFYVQDDMRFGKLSLLAAGRYDKVKGRADSVANSANPTGTRVTTGLDRSDGAFSGSLGASYELAPLLRPYANLSRGFRAGEMRERYESSPRGDGYFYVGNPQVKPEISTQFEVGIKGQDETLVWSAALYRNRIKDYMSGLDISGTGTATTLCGPNAGACKQTVNISKVVIDGFEAQGKWQVWQGHWLKAGLSVLRGDNEDLNEPLFQMPADELALGWEGHVAPGWTADLTGRFVREQNRVATVFTRGTENRTAGFVTADLGATYRLNKQHSFRVALKNAFDREYHEHLTEGISGQEIHMPGRSLVVSWKGDF